MNIKYIKNWFKLLIILGWKEVHYNHIFLKEIAYLRLLLHKKRECLHKTFFPRQFFIGEILKRFTIISVSTNPISEGFNKWVQFDISFCQNCFTFSYPLSHNISIERGTREFSSSLHNIERRYRFTLAATTASGFMFIEDAVIVMLETLF